MGNQDLHSTFTCSVSDGLRNLVERKLIKVCHNNMGHLIWSSIQLTKGTRSIFTTPVNLFLLPPSALLILFQGVSPSLSP